jgi:hypothetical protein
MPTETVLRQTHARRWVEERFGPIPEGLLDRLRSGMDYEQIGAEWGIHPNTIRAWTTAAGIRHRQEWIMDQKKEK